MPLQKYTRKESTAFHPLSNYHNNLQYREEKPKEVGGALRVRHDVYSYSIYYMINNPFTPFETDVHVEDEDINRGTLRYLSYTYIFIYLSSAFIVVYLFILIIYIYFFIYT